MGDRRAGDGGPARRIGRRALLGGLLGAAGWVLSGGAAPTGLAPGERVPGDRVPGRPPERPSPSEFETRPGPVAEPTPPVAEPTPPDPRPAPAGRTAGSVPMARIGEVVLHVPAAEAVLVAFHEAGTVRGLELTPLGRSQGNANATRFEPPPGHQGAAPYHVQVSRGRAAAPTSAVDVVLSDDQLVTSPVAGRVVRSGTYRLYGRHPDARVWVRPHDDPGLVVALIHLEGPTVAVGDRVEVGQVLADRARRFPFSSVVDTLTAPHRYGHVHIQVGTWVEPAPRPSPT